MPGMPGDANGAGGAGSRVRPAPEQTCGAVAERRAVVVARIAFGIVFFWNVLCAVQFVAAPADFAGSYELTGAAGEAAVRGIGVAFLMWNATYPPFIARPGSRLLLGGIILAQQAIGLAGESLLLAGLPAGHAVLAASVVRFIAFDAAGLVLMGTAFALLARATRRGRAGTADSAGPGPHC